MKAFYACNNGKDYLLELKDGSTMITSTELRTGHLDRYEYQRERDALSQFNIWISNSELRLPQTFYIAIGSKPITLKNELQLLGFTLPPAGDLKKFVLYHGKAAFILDDFDTKLVPEITLEFLKRINHKPGIYPAPQLVGGFL